MVFGVLFCVEGLLHQILTKLGFFLKEKLFKMMETTIDTKSTTTFEFFLQK
jgi:hypothetical protein